MLDPVIGSSAPIFVVGPPRSGTTLMARILGRNQCVFAPGESHYFEDVWTRRAELGELENETGLARAWERLSTLFGRYNFPETQRLVETVVQKSSLVQQSLSVGGGYGGLYYAFMNTLAASQAKIRFCDDTPKHLYYVHAIFELFPQARVIGCVRDPRDFLCSYKNYWRQSTESARIKALYHPIVTSLLWRSSSNLLIQHAHGCCRERMILIKYETLVENPQDQMQRVCDFLELDYSEEMIAVDTHNSSFEPASTGIFTSSVGRWRAGLDPEEAWWVQTLAKGNMRALDYPLEPVRPPRRSIVWTAVTAPVAFVRALRANARKRGPLLEYIWRRFSSLLGQ